MVGKFCKLFNSFFKKFLHPCTHTAEGEIEYQRHYGQERRNGGETTGKNTVDTTTPFLLLAFMRTQNGLTAHLIDKAETHICHCGTTVQTSFFLHLLQNMLDGFLFVLRKSQSLNNQRVILYELSGSKSKGNISLQGMILYEMHDGMQTTVNGSSVIIGTAEVLPARSFLITGYMNGMLHHLVNTFVLHGTDRDDWNTQQTFHLVDSDGSTVVFHFVHHVQRQYHRDVQLHQLHGKVKASLYARRVYDVNDAAGMVVQNKLAAHHLLVRVGTKAVNAGQVCNLCVRIPLYHTILTVDRHTGEVAYMLATTRQLVEKCCLSAVLITHKGKGQFARKGRGSVRLGSIVITGTVLTQSWVLNGTFPFFFLSSRIICRTSQWGKRRGGLHLYLPGICQAECQLIAVNTQLHRVTHRRKLLQHYLSTGYYTHVQEMLSQSTCSTHLGDNGFLSYFQITKRHSIRIDSLFRVQSYTFFLNKSGK